jgi:hypothetical protein
VAWGGSEPRPWGADGGELRQLGPGSPMSATCKGKRGFMAKQKAVMPDTLGYNIADRSRDLHRLATVKPVTTTSADA